MLSKNKRFLKFKELITRKRVTTILVVCSYIFFTLFYMGPAAWRCGDTLTGLGDSTGGPIWRASIEPRQPLLGGFQRATNFPSGENLYSPVGMVAIEQTMLMSGLSRVVGPVCAYNTINILGYLTTSIVMFAFIAYLLKNRWIAWLAGYAVAFTPYAQSKVGGHPSYGYASLLIGSFWLTLHIIKHRKWKHGFGLSAILAFCTYFDPYFILLVGTVVGPTLVAWMASAVLDYRKKGAKRQEATRALKVFAASLAAFLLLVSPMAYVRIRDAKVIDASTGAIRGNIEAAAMKCSNFPLDYILPDPFNVNLVRLLGNAYTKKNISLRNWCGTGESRVSVSLVVLATSSIGLVILLWERLNRRHKKFAGQLSYNADLTISAVVLVLIAALLLGLPPRVGELTTPTGILIQITNVWRIFARQQLVVNLMSIVLFAIVLKYFYETFKQRARYIMIAIFFLMFGVIMAEYQIQRPFSPPTFSYRKDVPSIYLRVRDDANIMAVAEYPLDRLGIETDSIVYYLTMQVVHKKSLLNSAAITNPNEKLHIAIKDLSDPQTIPVLRGLGLRHIIVHGLTAEQILAKTKRQVKIIQEETPPVYGLTMFRSDPSNVTVLAEIIEGPKLDYAVVMQKGFAVNTTIMKSPVDMEYETLPDSELTVTSVKDDKKAGSVKACFDVKMAATGDTSNTDILVGGKVQRQLLLTDQYARIEVSAKPGEVIQINNKAKHNTRINNLGCQN